MAHHEALLGIVAEPQQDPRRVEQRLSARRQDHRTIGQRGMSRARSFRRSEGSHRHFETAVKKTSCGCCGRVQIGWYDRKIRQVRDLSCGDMRILLELEVRRSEEHT